LTGAPGCRYCNKNRRFGRPLPGFGRRPAAPSQEDILTVTKRDLIHRIAEATGQTKVLVRDIVQRFLDEVADELVAGNRIEFRNFGVFEVRTRPPREALNPQDGSRIQVPPRRTVRFKLGHELRSRVEAVLDEGAEERQGGDEGRS